MKKLIISLCMGVLAVPVFAGYLDENTRILRVDLFSDEDALDEAVGWEIGFGTAVHRLDEVGIFGGMYENDDDDELKFAGLQIEEHYPLRMGVVPFAGVAVGYSDLEVEDEDTDGIFGRLQGGVKLVLSESVTVAGTARYWISSHENLIDGDRPDDHRLDFSVGLRFHY